MCCCWMHVAALEVEMAVTPLASVVGLAEAVWTRLNWSVPLKALASSCRASPFLSPRSKVRSAREETVLKLPPLSVTFALGMLIPVPSQPLSESRSLCKHNKTKETRGRGRCHERGTLHSAFLSLSSYSLRLLVWFSFHFTLIITVGKSVYRSDGDTWNGSPRGKARAFSGCNSEPFPKLQCQKCPSPQKLHNVVIFECIPPLPCSLKFHQIGKGRWFFQIFLVYHNEKVEIKRLLSTTETMWVLSKFRSPPWAETNCIEIGQNEHPWPQQ